MVEGGKMDSIGYYNKNSKEFYDRTINADQRDVYQKFLKYLPKSGRILDAGCGVGRDSKFFLGQDKSWLNVIAKRIEQ